MGYHIGLLIMAAIQYLCPKFLEEGRLCWLRAPLYIVTNGKKHDYYFTDEEYNKVRGKIRGEIHRNKGLGEMGADEVRESMFDSNYQRMDVLEPNDEALIMLRELMGEDVTPRANFIFKNIDFSEIKE